MLGSRAEAEDVVQDAYLRWHAADRAAIAEPRRYLGTVVTRLCLDRMKSARARRELYVGQWLPEPVVDEAFDDEAAGDIAHDISVALMLVLERLSPLERASFLLHDVFGVGFCRSGRTLGRAEAACRQLAARARAHIEAERPRFAASHEEGDRLAAAFVRPRRRATLQALAQILAEDVVLYTRRRRQARRGAQSDLRRRKVLRFLDGIARKSTALPTSQVRAATVNGLAGFVLREQDGSIDTMAFEHRDGRIVAIYITRNPDKLHHVRF